MTPFRRKAPLCPTAQMFLAPMWSQKLEGKFVVNPQTGCWDWTSTIDGKGYGAIYYRAGGRRRSSGAHRALWVVRRGPIVGGLDIDHLCMNKLCVNPDHLEPVTHEENMRRAFAAGLIKPLLPQDLADRQGCLRHGFADGKWYPRGKNRKAGGVDWSCRICDREHHRAARARAAKARAALLTAYSP